MRGKSEIVKRRELKVKIPNDDIGENKYHHIKAYDIFCWKYGI